MKRNREFARNEEAPFAWGMQQTLSIKVKIGNKMNEGMIAPYKKIVE